MKKVGRALAFWVAAVVLLSGCVASANASDVPTTEPTGRTPSDWISNPPPQSTAQRAALEDGTVDGVEYRAAFAAYRDCMREKGFELVDVDDSGIVIEFGIPDAAVQEGAEQLCYPQEFAGVDEAWQLAHAER